MSSFVDRRLNPKNKSAVNRQRFLKRFHTQIRRAVADAISKRSVTDIESGEKVRSFEGPADFMNTAAATPDGRVIAAGGQDGRLLLWNGTTGSRIGSFEPEN